MERENRDCFKDNLISTMNKPVFITYIYPDNRLQDGFVKK